MFCYACSMGGAYGTASRCWSDEPRAQGKLGQKLPSSNEAMAECGCLENDAGQLG